MLKRDYLLTNQPCEFTVTAVGEVKVLVLQDARWRLAAYRDPAKYRAKDPKVQGLISTRWLAAKSRIHRGQLSCYS